MKWISVKDRLPEERQAVVYYFKETGVHCGRYKKVEVLVGDGESYHDDCFFGPFGFLTGDVTHWMPWSDVKKTLPEPPGE